MKNIGLITILFVFLGLFSCKKDDAEKIQYEEYYLVNNSDYDIVIKSYSEDGNEVYSIKKDSTLFQEIDLMAGSTTGVVAYSDKVLIEFGNARKVTFLPYIVSSYNIMDKANYELVNMGGGKNKYVYYFSNKDYENAKVNQRPTVSFITPDDGLVIENDMVLSVEVAASDPDGVIKKVELYMNDTILLQTFNSPPYNYDIECVADFTHEGIYTIQAIAYDDNEWTGAKEISYVIKDYRDKYTGKFNFKVTKTTGGGLITDPVTFTINYYDGEIRKKNEYEGSIIIDDQVTVDIYNYFTYTIRIDKTGYCNSWKSFSNTDKYVDYSLDIVGTRID